MHIIERDIEARHYQRAFAEMPVGGPMDGAAYGEYLKKSKGLGMVLGIVAAVATMGAAVPMIATGVLATQIAGGVMMAGGLMTGIGAVTGNTKLMKIGGVLSLAGGVGGLASQAATGAGWGGAFAQGSGSAGLADFANNISTSVSSVFGGGSGEAAKAAVSTSTEQTLSLAPEASTSAGGVADVGLGAETGGSWNVAAAEGASGAGGSGGLMDTVKAAQQPVSMSYDPNLATNQLASGNITGTPVTTPPVGTKGEGFLNSFMDFAKTNGGGQILSGALKGGAEMFAKGVGSEDASDVAAATAANKEAETRFLDSRTSAQDLQTELMRQQAANASAVPVALDPNDTQYAAKKAAAQAAGRVTFDIATPAAGAVTRAPVQQQFTAPIR